MRRTKLSVLLIIVCAIKCLAMSNNELEDFADYLKKTSQLSPTLKKGANPDDYDDEEAVSDHAWEESGKFEGDLILNERQRRLIVQNVAEGLSRNGIRDSTKRWPNNEVIYYIQVEHFTSDQVQAIQSGIDDLSRASCVKFRRYRKGDRDAVVIQGSRRGCFSQVGYQGGYQVLNLSGRHPVGRGCFRHGTVIHELLHTLGFYHMQSSPDRDDYVNVIWENIVQQARHNFRKYNMFSVSDFGVGYDYDSVLHYSRRAFSANGQDTIVPKKSGAEIGQRIGLSDKDTEKLNKMYCDADSDNVEAGDDPTDKSKKKSAKNKPFQGHGIGYHQGKAVVIKILPEPETYKLVDVPRSHVFDYFSKKPQILSPSEHEGFRAGKEIEYSYNPAEMMKEHYSTEPETQDGVIEVDPKIEYHRDYIAEVKDKMDHTNLQESNVPIKVNNESDSFGETLSDEKIETHDPELIEALDRISKIIKSRVYPSQIPDLSIYKKYEQDNNSHKDLEQYKKENSISIQSPIRHPTSQAHEINQSAIRFINNLFDRNVHETDKIFDSEYNPTADASNYYNNEPKEKKDKLKIKTEFSKNKNSDSNIIDSPFKMSFAVKQVQNKHTTVAPYVVHTDRYHDNSKYNKYLSKLNGDEKRDDHLKWHDRYSPYISDLDHYEKETYGNYFKPDLEEDYDNNNSYSISVPTIYKGSSFVDHSPNY